MDNVKKILEKITKFILDFLKDFSLSDLFKNSKILVLVVAAIAFLIILVSAALN